MKYLTLFIFLACCALNIKCSAQNKSEAVSSLQGKWFVELNSNDIGVVRTILEFETVDNTFIACTRKNADRAILGLWKSTLARIFTNDFKNGSLIRITNGVVRASGDTVILAGIFRSATGSYYFNGKVINNQINAVLRNSKKEEKGTLYGSKTTKLEYPLDDYDKITAEAIDTAKSKIFNKDITLTKAWKSFEKTIRKKSKVFMDDVELIFAFYYFADKLPISHFALTRIKDDETETNYEEENYLTLDEKSAETALLKISSFSGSSSEVDSIFSLILSKNYKNLIVDLRNNTGGSIEAGMAFAQKVVNEPLLGGVFLTQKWFRDNMSIPLSSEYHQFPYLTEANYDMIIKGIHNEKGIVLKVVPAEENYKGNLFIITNKRTASTCEPIVYGLKSANRATIVGETTAGAMLNGEQFKLKSGFSVFVPTADYYTSDGYRIDQKGVKPTIEVKDKDPVEFILNALIKE